MKVIQIDNLTRFVQKKQSNRDNPNQYRLYDKEGLSPTLGAMQGGGLQPFIIDEMKIKNNTEKGNDEIGKEQTPINTDSEGNARTINCHYPCMNVDSVTRKSGTGYGYVRTAIMEENKTQQHISNDFRIRKLTERECFRLMGVRDEDIDKLLSAGISKTKLYKMAGNSIVCECLIGLFDKMIVNPQSEVGQQLSIF